MNLLRAVRPVNLFITALSQLMIALFLDNDNKFKSFYNIEMWFLIAGTILIMAAAYIINDFFDQEADQINKPNALYIHQFRKSTIWLIYFVLNIAALLLGLLIKPQISIFFLIAILILLLYNYQVKKVALVGNLSIAFLAAFSLFLVKIVIPSIDIKLLLFYIVLAFFLHFIREIVKDMQDAEGDKYIDAKTLPLQFKPKTVARFVYFLILVLITLIILGLKLVLLPYFIGEFWWLVVIYFSLFIGLPLFYLLGQFGSYDEKIDLQKLSLLLKYVMYCGIMSMAFL